MFQHRYSDHDRVNSLHYGQYDEPPVDYSEDEQEDREHRHCSKRSIQKDPLCDLDGVQCSPLPVIHYQQLWFDCLVGQGGFGKVYRAKYNGDCVAVKEPIYYDHSLVGVINKAIIDEAKLHYHLSHPNIIQLHGISFKADTSKVFLVMEYAHGKSLREVISKRALSPNVIIKFAIQISSAMEYLHNFKPRAIIHRDLKSPNSKFKQLISINMQ